MKVTVTGATGLLGRAVIDELTARGDEVTALSRDASKGREALGADVGVIEWADPLAEPAPPPRSKDATA